MIDGNLIWRGTPSFADSGMISQAAKNVDPSKSLSGVTSGAAFEAHILEMEGTAKAIEAPMQNGRRGFSPQNPDGEQKTPVEAGSDGTNASQAATQNSVSPSDDGLNSSLLSELYGNTGHILTADGALRLGTGILPESLASESPTAPAVFDGGDTGELQQLAPDRGTIELARERVTAMVAGEANSTATSGMMGKSLEVLETPALSSSASPDAVVEDGQSRWAHESPKVTGATPNRFTQKGTEEAGSGAASVVPAWADGAIQAPAQSQMALSMSDINSGGDNGNSELAPTNSLSSKAGKAERDISRDRVIETLEKESVTSPAPASPVDKVAAVAAQNQDSAATSLGSDLPLKTAAAADEKRRGGDVRSDAANDDGAVASSARAMQDLFAQNVGQQDVDAEADSTDATEPAHAARPREDRGKTPSAAPALPVNVIDIAAQAQNAGPDIGADRRADGNAAAFTTQSLSTSVREPSTAALTKDASPGDNRAAGAASSDQPVAVSNSTAKVDLAPIADAASVGLSVIGQSTSLAPPVASLLVQQVANPILAASRTIATGTGTNLPATEAVKTLEIRLVPDNLGNVLVKMRLAGDALQVQVEADHQGTLRLLMDNKDVLSQSIQSSGYKLDAMTLQTSSGDTGSTGGQASQGHRFESPSSPQGSGSSLGSSQQGENRTRDQSQLGKGREGSTGETSDGYAQESDRDRRSDSIYV